MVNRFLPLAFLATLVTVAAGQTVSPPTERVLHVFSNSDEPVSVKASENRVRAPMSVEDFTVLALRHNPTLAAAADRIRMARGRKLQARRWPNPVVGYHGTEVGNLRSAGAQGGFISQRLILGGKLQLDQSIAGKEINEAHYRFHAQEQRIRSDVPVRFYDALVAQRRALLAKELADIGDDTVAASKRLLDDEIGTENALLQAEIKADQSNNFLSNSENETVEAWRRLVVVVGLPSMPLSHLHGDLVGDLSPVLSWDDCYTRMLDGNPAILAARTRVDRARLTIQRARREPIPNVDLSVSVRHHDITGSEIANLQLGIPLPLFDKNRGNIRVAEAEWSAACNEVRRIELELQDRLAMSYRRYANARQQVERYGQRTLGRAKQSLDIVRNGYEAGKADYLTLLNAQETYVQVSLSYLSALREQHVAGAIIENQLLTGSLAPRRYH
ncbi:MAG TPA: TolC family protein [Planctomycetes bacterium]|nr:TolC family protein [Planctomycetota bacterium]